MATVTQEIVENAICKAESGMVDFGVKYADAITYGDTEKAHCAIFEGQRLNLIVCRLERYNAITFTDGFVPVKCDGTTLVPLAERVTKVSCLTEDDVCNLFFVIDKLTAL